MLLTRTLPLNAIPNRQLQAAAPAGTSSGFSFEEFDAPSNPDVRVTGDDEIDKFENQFPALDDSLPAVASPATQLPSAPSFGATPSFASPAPSTPFAPRPQQSASFSTPILRDPMPEEEPEVIKYVFYHSNGQDDLVF